MKDNMNFRLAEKCLYDYPKNLKRIEILIDDLEILRMNGDVHAQNYQAFGSHSEISDPVAKHYAKIEALENQIKRLQRNTAPITRLLDDLQRSRQSKMIKDYQQILELFYFHRSSIPQIAQIHKLFMNSSLIPLSQR